MTDAGGDHRRGGRTDAGHVVERAHDPPHGPQQPHQGRHCGRQIQPADISVDAIGFALEPFDLIGAWRDSDSGLPIDARATLVDGTPIDPVRERNRT